MGNLLGRHLSSLTWCTQPIISLLERLLNTTHWWFTRRVPPSRVSDNTRVSPVLRDATPVLHTLRPFFHRMGYFRKDQTTTIPPVRFMKPSLTFPDEVRPPSVSDTLPGDPRKTPETPLLNGKRGPSVRMGTEPPEPGRDVDVDLLVGVTVFYRGPYWPNPGWPPVVPLKSVVSLVRHKSG